MSAEVATSASTDPQAEYTERLRRRREAEARWRRLDRRISNLRLAVFAGIAVAATHHRDDQQGRLASNFYLAIRTRNS